MLNEGNPEAKMLLEWGKKKKNPPSADELCVNLSDRALEFEVYLPKSFSFINSLVGGS